MHFLIRETLTFSLIYVAACYLVGTGMCHNMVGLLLPLCRLARYNACSDDLHTYPFPARHKYYRPLGRLLMLLV